MDAHRFDDLIRSLATHVPRRGLLLGLGSGVLSLAAAGDDTRGSNSGRCKPRCAPCQQCKKGKCRKKKDGTKRCTRGRCEPSLANDPRHCGRCNNRCQINATCDGETCTCVNGACSSTGANCCPSTSGVLICQCA
jgi:hypothetical protein